MQSAKCKIVVADNASLCEANAKCRMQNAECRMQNYGREFTLVCFIDSVRKGSRVNIPTAVGYNSELCSPQFIIHNFLCARRAGVLFAAAQKEPKMR